MAEEPAVFTGPEAIQLRVQEMYLESGWLGRVFGSPRSAPMNTAGMVVVVFTIAEVAVLGLAGLVPAAEFWKIVGPVLTLSLGFMFGRRGG